MKTCDYCERKISKVYICTSHCGYHESDSCLRCLKDYLSIIGVVLYI